MGYAFVNFISVEDLLTFARARLDVKWFVTFVFFVVGRGVGVLTIPLIFFRNMFSSDKILHMSYANYQFVPFHLLQVYFTELISTI